MSNQNKPFIQQNVLIGCFDPEGVQTDVKKYEHKARITTVSVFTVNYQAYFQDNCSSFGNRKVSIAQY